MESYLKLIRFIIWCSLCLLMTESMKLSIGTYNLWNVMFNWNVRLRRVADMIREHDLDVVVFQEVRLNKCAFDRGKPFSDCSSQLDELKMYLPEYRWRVAHPAGKVSRMKASFHEEWEFEGLGIISRKEILSSEGVNLRQTSFQDRNKRIALHVKVKLGPAEADTVNIVAVHFSYDPHQQCDNANDVIKLIEDAKLKHTVILGDFNVYNEMSPAFALFVGSVDGQLKCDDVSKSGSRVVESFQDVWLSGGVKTHFQGLTFSNMPTPGPQSRPDRIVVSKSIGVIEVGLDGNGSSYWMHHGLAATYNRAWTVIVSAYHSFAGPKGYSCLHDCGPHGSCRCGVCVKGGDQNNCHLPECSECSSGKFFIFILLSAMMTFVLLILFIAVIKILIVSARFDQNDIMDILGYRCCLFNRQLFQHKIVSRKWKIRLMNILRLNNLPPVLVAIAALLLLCVVLLIMYFVFWSSLQIVHSILPEEKFSSDHKLVFARLEIENEFK